MRDATSLDDAVVALAMAAYHDLVSIEEAAAWVLAHPSYTGIERARRALALADENAWSPQEPRMHLFLVRRGFGPFLFNRPVFDLDGRHLGTPDLIDPATGVLGEYEGALHLQGRRRAKDLSREDGLRRHGLEPVVMVAADRERPYDVLQRVRSAYAAAVARPAGERRWTLDLPPRWVPTFTVAQRRALTDDRRERFLRHRRHPPPVPDRMAG